MGRYVCNSGRNDLDLAKVTRDRQYLYCYVRTREPLTPPRGSSWMLLLLNTDGDPRTGWEGYDLIVDRHHRGPRQALVEHKAGGWRWEVRLEALLPGL